MRAVVADDDRATAAMLAAALKRWSFDVQVAHDGTSAWGLIDGAGGATLAVIDWMMPGADGIEICRRARALPPGALVYVILLTARGTPADVIAGFDAGADDYLVKPFDPNELRARVHVGRRMLELQQRLADQVVQLRQAIASMKQLRGLLPICCYCKRIRSDDDYWQQVEAYISDHSDATFSHGICPQCFEKVEAELHDPEPQPSPDASG